jgi:hypothetical protein
MNIYLYIQNCKPFPINKNAVCRVHLAPSEPRTSTSTSNLEPRTSNLEPQKYILTHNPFAMNIYLYIQNRKPFPINKTVVYRVPHPRTST